MQYSDQRYFITVMPLQNKIEIVLVRKYTCVTVGCSVTSVSKDERQMKMRGKHRRILHRFH